jgi:hypothetical protein
VLLTAVICGSLVSCSLFRPKENDEDTWGDPNWKIGDVGVSRADRSTGRVSPELAAAPGAGERHLAGTSHDADYWPATQELEAQGGSLSIEHYQEKETKALDSSNEPFASASSLNQNEPEEMYPMTDPELPTPADGVDPLAGFWDDKEDYTDGTIQRADAPQEDPFIAGASSEPEPEPEPEPDLSGELQSSDTPPVLMPIPPSSAPDRAGGIISTNKPTLPKSTPEPSAAMPQKVGAKKVSDVLLLDAETSVTDAAFEGVSLLNSGAAPAMQRSSEESFLDRRQRVSLTDVGINSYGPLTLPSIEEAADEQ